MSLIRHLSTAPGVRCFLGVTLFLFEDSCKLKHYTFPCPQMSLLAILPSLSALSGGHRRIAAKPPESIALRKRGMVRQCEPIWAWSTCAGLTFTPQSTAGRPLSSSQQLAASRKRPMSLPACATANFQARRIRDSSKYVV